MSVRFGLFVPQGWKMDLVGIDDPVEQYEAMTAVAKRADQGPWDSVWVYDHFHTVPEPTMETTFEAWTVSATLARDTERVRIGQMVSCNGYRNPALFAKIASTVDVASGGRLNAGIGGGWYEHEWRAYGYGFPETGPRMRMFREGVQIMHKMFSEDKPTFEGEFYTIDEPINEPKSAKPGHKIPLWIGGGGEKVTLKLVAQYGDACNVGRDPELCRHKLQVLKDHCENLGRDYGEIIKSAELDAIILNEGDDADAIRENLLFDYTIVGKAQEIRDYVQRLVDAGIDYIIVYLPGVATNHDLISQFESEVIAHFAS
ncbi:MAG TPA: LLM class F420-dependent oxidoreductase [Thermomicrobiales bacterium]|nr:LLM class F420-dependent oxidoreductase [Thermomicrobiales bacterium]